ncbi:hypothetical protein HNQ08_005098 [Deinococcus humi]|uniref:Uncharacterized protein n=1 Tax=Deinococcus humi TaxID=662880 RepID=A0A7W8NJB8_9DEIO|nr:hypothetical protein [Deinococcus humi]
MVEVEFLSKSYKTLLTSKNVIEGDLNPENLST